MAIRIESNPKCSVAQAKTILEKYSQSVGVYINLDRVIDYDLYSKKNIIKQTPILREMLQLNDINPTQSVAIKNRVLEVFDVNPEQLMNKQRQYTLDKDIRKQVIEEPQNYDERFVEFIKFYHELAENTTIQSQIKFYLDAPLASARDRNGNRMVIVKPNWNVASTMRLQSNNPNFQGMARYMKDIITAPEGYQLVQADSGQIEPRIMYSAYLKDDLLKRLIEVYDDAYWGQLHFVMMTREEEAFARANLHSVVKKEWEPSLRSDLKVIGLAGNYGSVNLDRYNRELAPLYMQKIVNHPARKEWEEEVKRLVYKEGVEKFYSSFGTEIVPKPKEGKYNDINAWKNHLVRCGINNPLQTTAAELMAESVYEADKIIRLECKNPAAIAAYIHDAGYFYLHEDDLHLNTKFYECMAYDVRDWIPIRSEGQTGLVELSHVPVY